MIDGCRWVISGFIDRSFESLRKTRTNPGFGELKFVPGELMASPDAEISIVTEEKLCDYLLNPSHPVGGPKAAWFASIGYTRENWRELRDHLILMAMSCEDFVSKPSPYGVKYETSGVLGTEGHRPGNVVAVWIVEENSLPRLVTAYPGNG